MAALNEKPAYDEHAKVIAQVKADWEKFKASGANGTDCRLTLAEITLQQNENGYRFHQLVSVGLGQEGQRSNLH